MAQVGKIGQTCPLLVSKALEVFAGELVKKAAAKAKGRAAEREHQAKLVAADLKAVVDENEEYDFLREVVDEVAENATDGGGVEAERKPRSRAPRKKAPKDEEGGAAEGADAEGFDDGQDFAPQAAAAAAPKGKGKAKRKREGQYDSEDDFDPKGFN